MGLSGEALLVTSQTAAHQSMENMRARRDTVATALASSMRRMFRVILFSGLINLLTLSGSIYMLTVYDRVIPSRDVGTLLGLSLIVLLAYVLQGFLDALRTRMLGRIAAQFDLELQSSLFRSLAALPLAGGPSAQFQQPLRDLDQIRGFLAGAGPTAFLDMPWTPIFLIVLFLFHPLLGFTALFGALSIVLMTLLAERLSGAHALESAKWLGQRSVLADAARTNAEVIRALGMTSRLGGRWCDLNEAVLAETIKSTDLHAALGAAGRVVRYTLQSTMLGLGALLVVNDLASGGIMVASSIVMGRVLAPIEVALSSWRQLNAARAGLARLRVALAPFDAPKRATSGPARPTRSLTVRDLSVAAPGSDRPIVSGISFQLHAGTGLALIGPSGSGKSTLVRGLTGAWPLVNGEVRLDGTRLGDWEGDGLGRHIGYLPQNVGLFEGTVAENIGRFDPDAQPSDVMDAAQIAGAEGLIRELEAGYHTRIGPDGTTLSAGQRQRIGLARAVYGNPFLVVLDEPNANLDADGEMALTQAILALKQRGSVVIVVSHRRNALDALDSIMVLMAGHVLTIGNREQVAATLSQMSSGRPPAGRGRSAFN